ncbi:MAG: hypothetical protein WBR29_11140 [Gammaproteobacteria bacterium]
MKLRISVFVLFLLLAISACSRSGTPQVNVNFNYLFSSNGNGIKVEPERVIITNDQGHQAVITQQGALTIEDKSVAVSPQAKDNLSQFVETTQQIREQGMEVARRAGSFAAGILSDVFGGLLSGQSDKDIERNANQSAAEFKKSVLPICMSVQKLKHLQDAIVADVPAFKPYAVIEDQDSNDCMRSLNSKD